MLAGKKLTEYTNLFSPYDFLKNDSIIVIFQKMNKYNSIRAVDKTDLSEQTKYQLDEISKIENYFIEEINQRKSCSQKLSKYVTVFDYIDKSLIVLSGTNGGVSIISFTSIAGAPVGIISAGVTLMFSLTTGMIKKLLNITRKKHKILMFAKSRLNSIDTLISQVLIYMDISHEEFITILKEKDRYQMMKDNVTDKNWESYEIMRFNNSVKSKDLEK